MTDTHHYTLEGGRPLFVTFRPAPGSPPDFLPPGWHGKWFRAADIPDMPAPFAPAARAFPTGRLELRPDDGSVAEIWLVASWDRSWADPPPPTEPGTWLVEISDDGHRNVRPIDRDKAHAVINGSHAERTGDRPIGEVTTGEIEKPA